MRIVHFLNSSGHAGDAHVALLVAKQQRHIGHDAQIVIEQSQHASLFLERARAEGVPAHVAPELYYDIDVPTPRRVLAFWRTFLAHPNIILHMHTGRPLLRTADVLAARLLPLKARLATIHAPAGWSTYTDAEKRKRTWQRAAQALDMVLCPSAYARQYQLEAGLPAEKVHVQPNPVDITQIDQGEGAATRRALGLAKDDLMLLFLARLDQDKNPVDAIRGFGTLAKAFPNATLFLAGSGDQEQACQQAITELQLGRQVRLLGYRTDTANLLRAADIYLLPTMWENLSMSLLEAMAAELPIITTPVGGNLELLQDAETALFVNVHDTVGITEALQRLLNNSGLRRRLGRKAREAAQRYSLPTIAAQHIALYETITHPRLARPAIEGHS